MLGCGHLSAYPRSVIVSDDAAPRLAQKHEPRKLRYILLELRSGPSLGIGGSSEFEKVRSLSKFGWDGGHFRPA